jgi:hypothetical protein
MQQLAPHTGVLTVLELPDRLEGVGKMLGDRNGRRHSLRDVFAVRRKRVHLFPLRRKQRQQQYVRNL